MNKNLKFTRESKLTTPETDETHSYVILVENVYEGAEDETFLVVGYGNRNNCQQIKLTDNLRYALVESLAPHQFCENVYGEPRPIKIEFPEDIRQDFTRISQLHEQLSDLTSKNNAQSHTINLLKTDYASVSEDNIRLKNKLEDYENQVKGFSTSGLTLIEFAKRQSHDLIACADWQEAHLKERADLQERVETLSERLLESETANKDLVYEVAGLKGEKSQLKGKCTRLENANTKLKSDYDRCLKKNDSLLAEYNHQAKLLGDANTATISANGEIVRLMDALKYAKRKFKEHGVAWNHPNND